MSATVRRYWSLLTKVPRAPRRVDATRLQQQLEAEGFEVHLRSVQRDLEALSLEFPGLRKDDRDKPYGWYWEKDAPNVQFPMMGLAAAVTFDLARAHLQGALPRSLFRSLEPTFDDARLSLKRMDGARLARWPQKVRALPRGYPFAVPKVKPRVMDVVYDALLDEKRFQAEYVKRGASSPKGYEVSPLGLVLRDGVVILVCMFADRTDIRHMALHRIDSASPLNRAIRWPRSFSLDAHIARGELGYLVGDRVELRCRLSAKIASGLQESPIASDQELTPAIDGWCELSATVNDSMELRGWLRSLGALVEVLAPKPLRELMIEDAAALATLYQA